MNCTDTMETLQAEEDLSCIGILLSENLGREEVIFDVCQAFPCTLSQRKKLQRFTRESYLFFLVRLVSMSVIRCTAGMLLAEDQTQTWINSRTQKKKNASKGKRTQKEKEEDVMIQEREIA